MVQKCIFPRGSPLVPSGRREGRRRDMLTLSDRWILDLAYEPESGMGYQIASVTLKDGRVFQKTTIIDRVFIADVGGDTRIPFSEADIRSIVVDHGKKQSSFFYLKRFARRALARIKRAIVRQR